MKTIAYLTSQYPEFHETFVAREVEALRKKGVNVSVYSLKTPKPEERNLYPAHLPFIYYAPFFFSIPLLRANLIALFSNTLPFFTALGWLIRSYKKQPLELLKSVAAFPKTVYYAHLINRSSAIVHAHWATIPASMAVVIKMLTGRDFSFTAHAWDIFLSPSELLREKIAISNGVVTCTGYNVGFLKTLSREEDQEKIFRNYHGLDFSDFSNLLKRKCSNEIQIVAVGRLVEQKGFAYLIRAVQSASLYHFSIALNIVGEGPLLSQFEDLCADLPKNVTVSFTGKKSHKETLNLMASSDIMIAPSVIASDGDRDGIPNVILEAMACRLPVIGTDVSGIPEVVRDGDTGCLVPQTDEEALTNAILYLADNPQRRLEMGEKGRDLVEEFFDIKRNVEDFCALLTKFHNK